MKNFIFLIIDFFRNIFGPKKSANKKQKKPIPSAQELREQVEKQKKRIEEFPDDCAAHFLLGEAYLYLKQPREAMNSLKEAIRIDPNFMESFFLLGKACLALGRDEEAIEPLQKALERNKTSATIRGLLAETHTNLCKSHCKFKEYKEAILQFNEAVKADPDYGVAYLAVGITYMQMGSYNDALSNFKQALKLDKNLGVETHYNFGMVYSKLNDPKKALKHFKEATAINPKAALPQLRIGLIYMKEEKHRDAIGPLRAAVTYSPRVASEGFYQLGLALTELGQYPKAVEPLKEAVKVSPGNRKVEALLLESIYQTAVAHRKAGRVEEETESLKNVLEIQPAHGKSQYAIGEVYDNRKDGFNAVVHFTMARLAYAEEKDKRGEVTALRTLEKLYKKYGLNAKDFSKVRLLKKR